MCWTVGVCRIGTELIGIVGTFNGLGDSLSFKPDGGLYFVGVVVGRASLEVTRSSGGELHGELLTWSEFTVHYADDQ